jgi:hypothetical protein
MKMSIVVAVVLIGLGILGLVYGQFTYTEASETANLGPLELTVNDRETVNVPVWAGVGSIAVGAVLLGFALMKH